jgi:glycosyltransferase involved in cell wall biosynthesis
MNQTNQSLKIIIAVHHFPPTFKGGAEWRAHRTARWLQSQGHTVKVICVESVNDSGTSGLRWVDDEFDSVEVRRLFLNLSNAPDPAKWEYDNPWIEAHLSQHLAEEEPDIFHLISGYLMTAAAIRVAKRLDIPVVLTLTDFWFLCHRHTLQRTSGQVCAENTSLDCVRCWLEMKRRFRLPAQKAPALTDALWRWTRALPTISEQVAKVDDRVATLRVALCGVDVAICPSNFLKQAYVSKGFEAQQMYFLRQGLVHVPAVPPKKSPSARFRIGYIGQIAPHKGVHILIEAFLKLGRASHQAQLKLYGDITRFADYYRDLQGKVTKSLGDGKAAEQVRFLGTFENHQISHVYEGIDILVVPSIWYENSPNVILEAFAHQTPVMASNLGGMAELVEDLKTGILFAPNDADDLAQKLKMVLDDPQTLSGLQRNIVPPKTLEAELIELSQLYQSLLLQKDSGNESC